METFAPELRPRGGETIVQILTGAVLRCGEPVALSATARQVAVALALQAHALPAEALCELIYPDRDYDAARNILKVYIHRLRRRISSDFVVHAEGGYRLGPGIRTDIDDYRPLIDKVLRGTGLCNLRDRQRLEGIARAFRAARPAYLLDCEWYASAARRFARQGRDIAVTLAKDALQHDDCGATLRLARELIYEDPCDEEARELSILAHLQAGEQGAAVHEFQCYRADLEAELQATPSEHLEKLVRRSDGVAPGTWSGSLRSSSGTSIAVRQATFSTR